MQWHVWAGTWGHAGHFPKGRVTGPVNTLVRDRCFILIKIHLCHGTTLVLGVLMFPG